MARLQPTYLVVGDDSYLVSKELEKILEDRPEHSIDTFDAEGDLGIVLQSVRTPAMFSEERVIVVRDVQQLNAESLRRLIEYVEDPAPDSVLVLLSSKPLPKLAGAVKKTGRVVEAGKGKRSDVIKWVLEEGRSRGLKMSSEAAARLCDTVGEERSALAPALDQLGLMGKKGPISPSDIDIQLGGEVQAKLFGFVDSVASRQTGPALESLHRLMRQGEPGHMLFWTLAKHFKMLLLAAGRSPGEASRELGLPDWRAEKLVRQARNFTEPELISAYRSLAAADHKLKKSEEPEALTLERLVVGIAQRGSDITE